MNITHRWNIYDTESFCDIAVMMQSTHRTVHVGKRAQRATHLVCMLPGVPAKRCTVLLPIHWVTTDDGRHMYYVTTSQPSKHRSQLLLEYGRKEGRYGGERDQFCFRWMSPGDMAGQLSPWSADLEVNTTSPEYAAARQQARERVQYQTALVVEHHDTAVPTFRRIYDRMRMELDATHDSLARIVMWHWSRYYQHLSHADASALADSIDVDAPAGMSLTEANQYVSRKLYRLSRDNGWRKMTTGEAQRYRLQNGAGWYHTSLIDAVTSRTGCGEWTIRTAHDPSYDPSL